MSKKDDSCSYCGRSLKYEDSSLPGVCSGCGNVPAGCNCLALPERFDVWSWFGCGVLIGLGIITVFALRFWLFSMDSQLLDIPEGNSILLSEINGSWICTDPLVAPALNCLSSGNDSYIESLYNATQSDYDRLVLACNNMPGVPRYVPNYRVCRGNIVKVV